MSQNKYVTNIANADGAVVAPGLSTSFGAAVTGNKMHFGYIHKARGTVQNRISIKTNSSTT